MKHLLFSLTLIGAVTLAACGKKEEPAAAAPAPAPAAAPAAAPAEMPELKVAIGPTYQPFTFKTADLGISAS